MKSRITIDLDYDNQPIINIEYVESEDVRDKMVKRFMESFQGSSYIAKFFYVNGVDDLTRNRRAHLRPLPPSEFSHHTEYFKGMCEKQDPNDNDNGLN